MSKGMSRDRRYHERVDRRHENWPTCRQRVGRRPGRTGNDKAVRLIDRNEFTIDINIAVIQPRYRSLAYYNVVKRVIAGYQQVFAQQFAMHHRSGFNGATPFVDSQQRRVKLLEGHLGKESE